MRQLARHLLSGLSLSVLFAALYAFGCYEHPRHWNLSAEAWDVLRTVGIMLALFHFLAGFELSRLETLPKMMTDPLTAGKKVRTFPRYEKQHTPSLN
jgi:hypothetical protein